MLRGKFHWLFCLSAMLAMPVSGTALAAANDGLQIIAVDVDGGGGTLFITPEGKSVLIDAAWPDKSRGTGAKDSADRFVDTAPCLRPDQNRLFHHDPLPHRPCGRLPVPVRQNSHRDVYRSRAQPGIRQRGAASRSGSRRAAREPGTREPGTRGAAAPVDPAIVRRLYGPDQRPSPYHRPGRAEAWTSAPCTSCS